MLADEAFNKCGETEDTADLQQNVNNMQQKFGHTFNNFLIKAQIQLTYTLEKMQKETINNFNHSESGINQNNSLQNTSLKQIKRIEAAI